MVRKMNPSERTADDDSTGSTGSTGATGTGATGTTGAGKHGGLLESELASSVKESAQQIWLAGMGAFAKAQEEGGKVFEALVKEGSKLQKKTQGIAEEKIVEVTGKMSAMADTVTSRAGQNWDKLEAIFEQRTAKALGKLGVPTAKDVDGLIKRVDDLAAKVAKMGTTVGSRVAGGARKSASTAGSRTRPAARTATETEEAATSTPAKPAVKTAATKRARKTVVD